MPVSNHFIIYSHGFGVQKNDRGLLTAIAAALPEVESILFDYFTVDENAQTITMRPLSEQAAMLTRVIEETKAAHPDAIIDIIAHSQGTVVAALAKPDGVRKAILLAPSFDMSVERTLKRYQDKPQTHIDLNGISRLPILDGLVRVVPAAYWAERRELQPFREYNSFAEKSELTAIIAKQDEIVPKVDLSELSQKVKVMELDGGHEFRDPARALLIEVIRNILLTY